MFLQGDPEMGLHSKRTGQGTRVNYFLALGWEVLGGRVSWYSRSSREGDGEDAPPSL